ncbi:hypothetical protein HMPREF1986_01574 [Oribacterium sp. oral taxon 078 str. F0263]|nr:hypothetical protein HMPREF1986_01574 [Oribacterium sp. oral taxon 078 str. F0263]
MIHGFLFMGVPQHILTDNMKSVVIRRDPQGKPIWQHDYELFMGNIGSDTRRLCRHDVTKRPLSCMIEYGKIMRKDSRRIDGNLLSC